MANKDQGKLELIAHQTFSAQQELVRVVDFMNKSLKSKGIMFGITKDKDQMTINIYEF